MIVLCGGGEMLLGETWHFGMMVSSRVETFHRRDVPLWLRIIPFRQTLKRLRVLLWLWPQGGPKVSANIGESSFLLGWMRLGSSRLA